MLCTPLKDEPRPPLLRRRLTQMLSLTFICATVLTLLGAAFVFRPQVASAAPEIPAGTTEPVDFGLFADPSEYVDLVKQGARFDPVSGAPALVRDEAGWPTSDFRYIPLDPRKNKPWRGPDFDGINEDVSGTYKLSFTGQATLTSEGEEDPEAVSYENVVYNAETNTTTADVVVKPNHWLVIIAFKETKRLPTDAPGTGVTNVRMIRPGYPADSTQLFTDRYLDAIKGLSPQVFRSFETGINSYNIWNGTELVVNRWEDRSLPSDAYWHPALPSRNTGAKSGLNMPWEQIIQLCNIAHADCWFSLPVGADDDYVRQLATLIKNGNEFTEPLHPDLNVYIENSNEVWNYGFSQAIYNKVRADAEGISDLQHYVKRSVELSNLFREVYGDADMLTKVRPISVWQYTNQLSMQDAFWWAQDRFGAPINSFLWGIGEAPYVDPIERGQVPYSELDPGGVDRIMDTFYTSAGARRQAFAQWQTVATYFGLHQVGYESGTSLIGGIEGEVNRHPRMKDFIPRYYMENYFAVGGEAVNMFALGPGAPATYGDWFLFENWNDLNHPKYQGTKDVAGRPIPEIIVGNVLPWSVGNTVTIDASQNVTGPWSSLAKPGTARAICPNGCWPNPGYVDYMLRVPAEGTYTLTLRGQVDNTALQIETLVDNTSVGTLAFTQTGETSASVSVTLTPGMHTLVLRAKGAGKLAFATGGGIEFALTSGGGEAVKASAPLNPSATVNDGQANLLWETVTTATSYTIKRSVTSGGPYTTVGTSTTNSFTDSGLTNDTSYYYVVTASNEAGESVISPQVHAIPTQAVTPGTPAPTAESGASDWTPWHAGGQALLSWSKVPNATQYIVKRGDTPDGPFNNVSNQPQWGTVYHEPTLTPGQTYYYTVTAKNSFGESAPSAAIAVTPTLTVPDAPTNLAVEAGDGQVSLSWLQAKWQYPSFGELFRVKRGTSPEGPFTTISAPSTNNLVDINLTNGQTYCYVVTGVNGAGESVQTAPQCATPQTPPGKGTGLTGTYYRTPVLRGPVVLERTDATVNFDWGYGSPDQSIPHNAYSVRWSGKVEAPVTGDYIFATQADDGVRVWVNGTLIIQDWHVHAANTVRSQPIRLEAGQKYDILIEYFELIGKASINLKWSYPGKAEAIVPQDRLYTE